MEDLETIGNVSVEKNIFDVKITIPKDFIGETTQEELDRAVAEEEGFQSATLNEDGSVTYVMTKAKHKEMLDSVSQSINDSLQGMAGSEQFPNIISITANSDYTRFTVTTINQQPDFSESFAALTLYISGEMYAVFAGETVENIHVDYVNEATGEIIASSDSNELSSEQE